MVSFILNGTEKTTGIGFSLKSKRAKSKVKFLLSIFSEYQDADHYISTRAPQFYANSLKQLFFSYTDEKTYSAVHFTKGCILTEK